LAASHHTHQFVIAHWPEDQWEVAWFVNPPVGQTCYFLQYQLIAILLVAHRDCSL
jgi:hypothetical protein